MAFSKLADCEFCGLPADPSLHTTWQQVTCWTQAKGTQRVYYPSKPEAYAHKICVEANHRGGDQFALFGN